MTHKKYQFVVAQKAVIQKGKKYLIVKRSPTSKTYPEHWDFPGGKLEHGENPKEGIAREILEETRLHVTPINPLFVFTDKKLANVYFVLWKTKGARGKIKISGEHTAYKWATKEEILRSKTEPYMKEYLRKHSK